MKRKFISYLNLFRNINNFGEYFFHKSARFTRKLNFVTKPYPLTFSVDKNTYPVFKEIFFYDFYKIKTIKNVVEKPVVIDIGANTGFFTWLLLSKKPGAQIFAYEPFPTNAKLFRETMQKNPVYASQVSIFEKAVTDKDNDEIEIFVNTDAEQSAVASIYNNFDSRNTSAITASTTSLAAIVQDNNLSAIDILKMDCEGAEYPILYSTPHSVLKKVKLLLLEVHNLDKAEKNVKSLENFLDSAGFTSKSSIVDNGCYYLIATNNT